MENTTLSVSDAIALINQTLDFAYPSIVVEGEVSSFKVNQQKYVFFDLKDEQGTLSCFMTVFQLRMSLEDGMKVRVVAQPKLTQWGKFSLTVRDVRPVGEGSLKRSFELLRAKLEKEGLFSSERKRPLPSMPQRIGVISSTQAAGYADFIKILNDRWGGLDAIVAHVTVQGMAAPQQIINALTYMNQLEELPSVIVIIRGGGSADDLSAFNDEPLVRAIAGSRVPILTGIGHEVDTSLADLAADRRAPTPSGAAMIVVPDRAEVIERVRRIVLSIHDRITEEIDTRRIVTDDTLSRALDSITHRYRDVSRHMEMYESLLVQLNPKAVLNRGYSILKDASGKLITTTHIGDIVTIETKASTITAGVTHVEKNNERSAVTTTDGST